MTTTSWCKKLEQRARQQLEPAHYDFIAGGADDEAVVTRNIQAFRRYAFVPRTLVNVSHIDLELKLLNTPLPHPFLIAPAAPHKLLHPDGELAMLRAANHTQTPMIVSFMASTSLETIADHAHCPLWFQLQILKNRAATLNLLRRAEDSGYQALVITVDMPCVGNRYRDTANKFKIPIDCLAPNLLTEHVIQKPAAFPSLQAQHINSILDPSVTWETLEWLRHQTKLPLLLKGILHPDDARLAINHGIDGLIVSNHGGRQLGACIATLDALKPIADTVAGKIPILMDGGIRCGADIVIARALGASAILLGRPLLWGLSLGGHHGVTGVMNQLKQELITTMMLCGVPGLKDINTEILIESTAHSGE